MGKQESQDEVLTKSMVKIVQHAAKAATAKVVADMQLVQLNGLNPTITATGWKLAMDRAAKHKQQLQEDQKANFHLPAADVATVTSNGMQSTKSKRASLSSYRQCYAFGVSRCMARMKPQKAKAMAKCMDHSAKRADSCRRAAKHVRSTCV